MTCPDCEGLRKRVEELENSLLRFENADLKRRLAFYENAHTAPSQRKFPAKKRRACGGPRFPGRPKGFRGVMVCDGVEILPELYKQNQVLGPPAERSQILGRESG